MAKMTRKINNTNILQDMEALCEKMASQNQETVVMSVNKAKNSVYCHGSRLGRKFLLSDNEVCQRFVKFCADVFNAGATTEDQQNGDFVIPVKTIDEILHPVVIDTQQNLIFGSKSTTSTNTNTIDENEIGKAEDNETNLKTESQTKIRIGTYVDLNPADDLDLDLTAQSPSVKSVLQTEDDVEDDSDIVEEYSSGNEVYVSKKNDQSMKDFSCDICSKRLGSKASLQRHKLLHREKSKSCDVCGKKFYRSDDVAKHMKVHQSEADRDKGKKSCCVCGRNFQRATSLKLHMKSAHKTDDSKVKGQSKPKLQYVCTVCNVDFRNKFGLDRHMKCHENIKIFKCYVCNESFRTDKQLQTHVANHQVMLMFKCVLCGDVFQSDPELKEHQSKSCAKIRKESLNIDTFSNGGHGDVNNSANSFLKQSPDTISEQHVPKTKDKQDSGFCDLDLEETNKMSPSSKTDSISKSLTEVTDDGAKSQTNAGVPSSHNPKGHTCDICNRCFKQPLALYKHRLYHDNFGMFACRFCDYVTKSKVNLNRHSKRHLDIKPHTCDVCSKGFTEKHNLSLHMLSHTKERPHLCDTCGKGFRTAQLLKRHKRVHTGERPYVCKQCGKSFMTADVLRNHENIHSNYRGYICDVCGMSFNQKCSLYTHKHKHSDKPSHICTECGKGCRSAASLKIHFVSKHLKVEDVGNYGLKVYECEKCHKLFADKSDLNIHLRTHTGEKPYKCQFCEKAFADKSNLRTHEKIHLDIRPFTCDRCGKGFILNRDLLKHMKSHPHVNSQEENQGYHIEQSSLNLGDSDMILSTEINNVLQTLPSYTEL